MSKENYLKWILVPLIILFTLITIFIVFKMFYIGGCSRNGQHYYDKTFDRNTGEYCDKGKWYPGAG
jgi:uncharacterized membrane protein